MKTPAELPNVDYREADPEEERESLSFLAGDEPLALGTNETESLSSYVRRVAADSGFTPGQFFYGRAMKQHARRRAWVASIIAGGLSPIDNGTVSTGRTGCSSVQALARATLHPEIVRLHWSAGFSDCSLSRLIRPSFACCPACLRSDRIAYGRLRWDLTLVRACEVHRGPLIESCPQCGEPLRRMACNGVLGVCRRCHADVRDFNAGPGVDPEDIAVAAEIGEIVALMTLGTLHATGPQMFGVLRDWATRNSAVSLKQQAKFLGMRPSVVSYWRRPESGHLPSLLRLLELCLQNGLSMLSLVRNEAITVRVRSGRAQKGPWTIVAKTVQDRTRMRAELEELACRIPPLSLDAVAERLHTCSRTLRSASPIICVQVVERWAAWRHRLHLRKERWFRFTIDRAVADIVAGREWPTWVRIAERLRRPGILRQTSLKAYARDAMLVARASYHDARLAPHVPGGCEMAVDAEQLPTTAQWGPDVGR